MNNLLITLLILFVFFISHVATMGDAKRNCETRFGKANCQYIGFMWFH